jgi:hypothetical protein
LANRTQFRDKLNSALSSESSPFALHTIDLDCFKEINDTLGHLQGTPSLRLPPEGFARAFGRVTWLPGSGATSLRSCSLFCGLPKMRPLWQGGWRAISPSRSSSMEQGST